MIYNTALMVVATLTVSHLIKGQGRSLLLRDTICLADIVPN